MMDRLVSVGWRGGAGVDPIRRYDAMLWLLAFVVLLAAWWSVGNASAQRVERGDQILISAMGLPEPADVRVTALAARAVLQAFFAEYPEVRIEPFAMPEVAGSAMDSGPLLAIAAGMPPDAIYVNFRQSSTYLGQGFLQPLEILLARVLSENADVRRVDGDGGWLADPTDEEIAAALEAIRQRTAEPAWPVVYREDDSGVYDSKHVWAMPTGFLVQALLYRKDLFAAAGLDPQRPPENWEEFLDYAQRLTVPERRQSGVAFGQGLSLSYSTYNLLASTGMRAVKRGDDGTWRATFGTRGAAEATYFVWRLMHEPFERDGEVINGAAFAGGFEIYTRWGRGQIGMFFSDLNQEMLGSINPQLVGIAPPPRGPNGQRASQINATMLGVYAESSPQQQLAAMRYIWFTTGETAQQIRTRVYVEQGYGQFVNPDLLAQFGYDRVLKDVPPGWQAVFEEAMAAGVPEPYGRNTQNIYRYMSEPMNEALTRDYAAMSREDAINDIFGLFQEAQSEVNQKVLGNFTPRQLLVRRAVGLAVMIFVFAGFAAGFIYIWRYFSRLSRESQGPTQHGAWANLRRYRWGYLLLAPALLITVGWMYLPLGAGFVMSFTDYRIVLDSTFVGVDNFANVLFDDRFWSGFGRTLMYVALAVGLGFWPPILLALLLDEVPTAGLKYFFRTVFYLPAIISGVIVMFLWKELYDPSPYGAFNQVYLRLNALGPILATGLKGLGLIAWLSLVASLISLPIKIDEMSRAIRFTLWAIALLLVGITVRPVLGPLFSGELANAASAIGGLVGRFELQPLPFIQDPQTAMFWVVLPMVWMTAGPACLIYLAALKTIPSDLYEAADIDGASNVQKVFYVTLPRLKYLITIQFVFSVVAAFKGGADFILAMTGGGPNNSTMILALEIFIRTFLSLDFGIGAAMAWILGSVLIGFTAYQMKILARSDFQAAK